MRCRQRQSGRAGFTLLELLVVVGLIALLLSLILVAMNLVSGNARTLKTEQLCRSLAMGAEQFNADHGYHPPLLDGGEPFITSYGADRADLLNPSRRLRVIEGLPDELQKPSKRFSSMFSLPIYLAGLGDINQDEEETAADDGVVGPGIKSPGPDRSWGGAADRSKHSPSTVGRTYGPYLDFGAGEVLRRLNGDVVDGGPACKGLYVFVDQWGSPIQYYKNWPTRKLDSGVAVQTLERVPVELFKHSTVEAFYRDTKKTSGGDAEIDSSLEPELFGAPFAVLSPGSDGVRADATFAEPQAGKRLDTSFNNNDELRDLSDKSWEYLLDSLEDNVRVTP